MRLQIEPQAIDRVLDRMLPTMPVKHRQNIRAAIVRALNPMYVEFDRMWNEGATISYIAETLGVDPAAVGRIRRRRGLPTRRGLDGKWRGSRYGVNYVPRRIGRA